jgi:hypothetical protein
MFRMPKPTMIESDTGFSVELVELSKLVYREGGKKVTLTVEHLVGPAIFVVYLAERSDRWDPPFGAVRISDEEWRRIGDNIREAYRSQGFETEVCLPAAEARESSRRALDELKRTLHPPDRPKQE